MKLGIHITFYYIKNRLPYLEKVLDGLEKIEKTKTIFIYTNIEFDLNEKYQDVEIVVNDFANNGHKRLSKLRRFYYQTFLKLGITKMVHPYYLTWINRTYVESYIDEFDAQMYIEDDIYFDNISFNYWLKNKTVCIENEFNLGFLRVEEDDSKNRFLTDLTSIPKKIIELQGEKFLLNDVNPYYGFWIYDKSELKKFIKSKEWKFKFKNYGVRERSAIGWHGFKMKRYKGSLIPLIKIDEDLYQCDEDCAVHHLPNNYIGSDVFCQYSFPFEIKK
ncbi:hypothetical protein [Aquimarina sp. RZ0]|uniref:hypothetical protein n=1 Tax=Aquimarina sp. RZ0 TaxID=2607730 RepID=UPI0011F34069|nr:hypothetical protein [Aquimarina sp. RZ0]KAA1247844.1 hypothetical protein F0000_01095 [Aquimarina sp. RZ0]